MDPMCKFDISFFLSLSWDMCSSTFPRYIFSPCISLQFHKADRRRSMKKNSTEPIQILFRNKQINAEITILTY